MNGEISIQINYPNGGLWDGDETLGLDDTLREFIGLSAVDDAVATSETLFHHRRKWCTHKTLAADLDGSPIHRSKRRRQRFSLTGSKQHGIRQTCSQIIRRIPPADTREPYEMYIRPVHGSNSLVGDIITLKLYAVEGIGVDSFGIATEAFTN